MSCQQKKILFKDLKEGNIYDFVSSLKGKRCEDPFLLIKLKKRGQKFFLLRLFKNHIKESIFFEDKNLYYIQLNNEEESISS